MKLWWNANVIFFFFFLQSWQLALSLLYDWVHVTERIRISPLEPILINYFLIVSFLEFKWCQLSFPCEKFLRAREYQRVKLSLGPTLRFRDLPANYLSLIKLWLLYYSVIVYYWVMVLSQSNKKAHTYL